MAFIDLPTATQVLVQFRFDFFAKCYLFLFVLLFACAYIWYFKPKQQPTPFFIVGFLRLITLLLSWCFLVLSPLVMLMLSPRVPLDLFIQLMIAVYLALTVILTVIMFVNIFYFGGMWVISFMNVSPDNAKMRAFKQFLANTNYDIHEQNSKSRNI